MINLKKLTTLGGLMFSVPGKAEARRSGIRAMYKPPEQEAYEGAVAWTALAAARANGAAWEQRFIQMGGPIWFGVVIYRPMPATNKPDLSNFVKLYEDALNRIIYRDDAQIVGYLPGTRKAEGPHWVARIIIVPEIAMEALGLGGNYAI